MCGVTSCWLEYSSRHHSHRPRVRLTGWGKQVPPLLFTWATAVVLSMQRCPAKFDLSLRKALLARKAASSLTALIWSLASKGDQQPFAVRLWHHAPQPALEAFEVIYSSGAGGLMVLLFTVTTCMFWSHHWSSVWALLFRDECHVIVSIGM